MRNRQKPKAELKHLKPRRMVDPYKYKNYLKYATEYDSIDSNNKDNYHDQQTR